MTTESVYRRMRELWAEVISLEEQDKELVAKRKSVGLQIDAKMARIRKLGTLTKEQMSQLTMFDDGEAEADAEAEKPKKRRESRKPLIQEVPGVAP